MKHKKIIIISIIGLFIIGFFSLYNSIDTNFEKDGERDNYFNYTLKRVVPQNIKDFIKNTIFVFKKVSFLEQELADKNKQLIDKDYEILDIINYQQFFEFKKNEIKNKKSNFRESFRKNDINFKSKIFGRKLIHKMINFYLNGK